MQPKLLRSASCFSSLAKSTQINYCSIVIQQSSTRNSINISRSPPLSRLTFHVCPAGMYTGYNALSMALAMPPNGRVVACEIEEEYINIAKPFFKEVRGLSSQAENFETSPWTTNKLQCRSCGKVLISQNLRLVWNKHCCWNQPSLFPQAGVEHKIEIKHQLALQTLGRYFYYNVEVDFGKWFLFFRWADSSRRGRNLRLCVHWCR